MLTCFVELRSKNVEKPLGLKLFRSGEGEAKLANQGFKHVVERKRDEEFIEI